MTQIVERLIKLLTAPIKSEGYELLEIECKRQGSSQTVQLIIDSNNGIGIDDCVAVNQVAQEVFDTENPISDSYIIEVSSPGIFRRLKTAEHFQTFTGKRIRVRLHQKIHGVKNMVGELEESTEHEIRLKLESDGSGLVIPFSLITKANLEPDLKF